MRYNYSRARRLLTRITDELDAEAVGKLTKRDMSDFFTCYISPLSSMRAKVSVHLLAEGTVRVLGNESPDQKKDDERTDGDSDSGHVQGHMYMRTPDGFTLNIDRFAWKAGLDSVSVEPVQDIANFQVPTLRTVQ